MNILKSGGYCSDGCQWRFCDYYKCTEEPTFVVIDGANLTTHVCRCTFFNNTKLDDRGSLTICNKVYGLNYEGRP